jgi:glycosyltransferase involved in cell wall biosynthesis
MPKISVIIPCYCAAAALPAAIASVLDQDFADVEILVIDDASPDGSATVARRLALHDARIRVIAQPMAGPAVACNRGIKESYGEFIAFLDANDRWAPDLLRRHLINFAVEPGCGVAFARLRFPDPETPCPAAVPSLSLARILGENPVCTISNIVARRSVLAQVGGFDPSLAQRAGVQEWIARVLATTAWQVRGLRHTLVHCAASPRDLPADLDGARDDWISMLRRVRGYAPGAVARVEAGASIRFHLCLARLALRTGQGRRSLRPLMGALRATPRALLPTRPRRGNTAIAPRPPAPKLPGNSARGVSQRSHHHVS